MHNEDFLKKAVCQVKLTTGFYDRLLTASIEKIEVRYLSAIRKGIALLLRQSGMGFSECVGSVYARCGL